MPRYAITSGPGKSFGASQRNADPADAAITVWTGETLPPWVVACVAVAVNVLSLRRTVRHSRQNRIDARTDKLRGEIAAFISALSERPPMAEIWKKRLEEIGRPTNPAALADWARNVRPLVEEMLAPMYQRISAHAFGILMLTDDENITAPVHRLEQLTIDEITDARNLVSKSENAPSHLTGALSLLGHAIAPVVRGLPRQTQVEEATQKLKSYCLQHFPRWKADFTVCQAGRSKFNTRHKLLTGWW